MSLFDDLLKQSTPAPSGQSSGQSGGNPPQDDPLATTTSPIVISESTPMISVLDIVEPRIEVPAGTPMHITESNNSIIIDESEPETVEIVTPIQIENTIPDPIESTTEQPIADETSLLFGMSETPVASDLPTTTSSPIVPEESISNTFEMLTSTPMDQEKSTEDDIEFHDTNTYIDHAIEEVSGLIAGIDAQDAMVLAAEDEHRKQKEYFAGLEIADEAAHQKHLEERAHAEKMKKYLEKEQGAALKKNEEKEVIAA